MSEDDMSWGPCWQCNKPGAPCMTGLGHCEEHPPPGSSEILLLRKIAEAAKAAGTHEVNHDTCGVCGHDFEVCGAERAANDDEPGAQTFPVCAGARIRLALAELELASTCAGADSV
jgi:hypothetical protein